MKIFLISNMYPSTTDKLFGVFVKNFRIELEKQDIIFSKTALIRGQADSFYKKFTSYILHHFRIIRCLLSLNYDLIYVHYLTHHIPVLFLLLPFKKKPWVLNSHGSDVIGLQKNTFLDFFARIIFKKTDLLVVPTSYFKEKVLKNYPFIEPEKIFISPSGGIDPEKFYPKNLTNLTNLKPQTSDLRLLTLGFVSRFVKEKGWKTFLDVLVLLKKEDFSFRAIMAGKGPDEEKIKKYIQQKKLTDRVDFRGFISQEKLVDIYNEVDIYIFPTWHDSLGLTGVEAMACGTPIIASNVSGPSTYVESGRNGFLFIPQNPADLANLIHEYTQLSAEEKKQLCENALKTAERFEQGLVAKLLKTRLNRLLHERQFNKSS
jgi:glycosyltransferase involved in cell wall biosynthesis